MCRLFTTCDYYIPMRIAIDIPAHYSTAWKIAAGALEYAVSNWKVAAGKADIQVLLPHAPMARDDDLDPSNWDAAIISRPRLDLDVPLVCVSSAHVGDGVGVTISEDEVVKLAVEQFASMGLGNLAFFGSPTLPISKLRWSFFAKHVERLGGNPIFVAAKEPEEALKRIRKPCGILAVRDELGLLLLQACKRVGLRVPGDVHVISIDDIPACVEGKPNLSSISLPLPLLGFHAARLCTQMVNGASVESIQLPPSGLIIRESIKIENEEIRTASEIAHYLRANLAYPIQMEDVVRLGSISRRQLERVFRSTYGSSPIGYLKELRFEHAKETLRTSDASLKDVARDCGYRDANHLCRVFREQVGLTPMLYRETNRDESG